MSVEALRRDVDALLTEARQLVDNAEKDLGRDLTDEERAQLDALITEAERKQADIEKQTRLEGLESALSRSQRKPPLEDTGAGDEEEKGGEPDEFRSTAEFLLAVRAAYQPGGPKDPRLRWTAARAATGSNEAFPSDGGVFVTKDLGTRVLEKVWRPGGLAARCDRWPVGASSNGIKIPFVNETSRADGSRWGGIRGYWLNEADEKTASKPEFGELELNLQKVACLWYATDEVLQDTTQLEAFANRAFPAEINFKVEDALINGNGAGKPLGILNSPALVTVAKETNQAAATVLAENIEKMYSRMWAPSLDNAAWFINQDVWPQIFQLRHTVGTGGVPMFVPAGGLTDSPAGRLLNRPIVPIEYCATLGTVGDIIFADMSEYLVIDKGGIQTGSSIHVRFVYDETVFRYVYRINGQPKWNNVLTPFKGTATQSPFIALATRSA